MNARDTIRDALWSVSADDRDTWIRMGMALKTEFGDSAFDIWDNWSRQAESYRAPDARAAWRSFKPRASGITIASLYYAASQNGWTGSAPARARRTKEEVRLSEARRQAELQRRAALAENAARRAKEMIFRAQMGFHPYLSRKGFPEAQGLVLNGNLLIPMRSSSEIVGLQSISESGDKRFLKDSVVKGANYRIGRGAVKWFCEGYATALSIQAALDMMRRTRDEIVVCFSASNLEHIARRGLVIADHDLHSCYGCKRRFDAPFGATECVHCGSDKIAPPAGEKSARATRLPYWLPPEYGDANDYHNLHGSPALAAALRDTLSRLHRKGGRINA